MAHAFILAGEVSGDKLAASLMRAQSQKITKWTGVGGPAMAAEGLEAIANYEQLHIIGVWDALLSYRRLKQLLNHIVTTICKTRPEVIYTVDSKGFSLKLAQTLRAEMKEQGWSAPIIHMVAPTIWAYGAGRKDVFAEAFDEMLCLFPQEAPLWDDTNLKTHFIGHPAAYQATIPSRHKDDICQLLLLPGSRKSEIEACLPTFLDAVTRLSSHFACEMTIATTEAMAPLVRKMVENQAVAISIVTGRESFQQAVGAAHLMMAASGTVTLETALAGLPGVTAYRLNWLTTLIMKQRFQLADPILPNILLGKALYPFFLNQEAKADVLAQQLTQMWQNYPEVIAHHYEAGKQLQKALTGEYASFEDAIQQALSH